MKILVSIFLILIFILLIRFFISFRFKYNVIENHGFIIIYLNRLSIIKYHLFFKNLSLVLYNHKKYMILDLINFKDFDFINAFFIVLIQNIKIKNIDIYLKYGDSENIAKTALISSLINILKYNLNYFISNKFEFNNTNIINDYTFFEDNKKVRINTAISVSISQIIKSLLVAKFKKIKDSKEVKNYGTRKETSY
jgi:hypothetical protein